MGDDIKLWEIVNGEKLQEIAKSTLMESEYAESDLEAWLSNDISLIGDDLLVIGKQVKTSYKKEIDLLCIDRNGKIIIVELKRGKTPREVVAQILDYASWIKELSFDDIRKIADDYLGRKHNSTLEVAFREEFDDELPEIINETHGMLIVAASLDDETERIIKYLSDTYGVDINFIRFQFFKKQDGQDGQEIMARVFLIDPVELEQAVVNKSSSKRTGFSLVVGTFNDAELKNLLTASLERQTDLTPRLRKFLEILLLGSNDKHFDREEIKQKLLDGGIGKDVGQAGSFLSNISQFITKRDNSHLRQVIEFSSDGAQGQQKNNYKIMDRYRELLSEVLSSPNSKLTAG